MLILRRDRGGGGGGDTPVDGAAKVQPVKKSVSFQLENNEVHEFSEDTSIPQHEIWYVADQYIEMKTRSRHEAREWRQTGFGMLLRETFAFPRPDAQEYITAFVLLEESQSRRGLERNLCRKHGEERSEMKDRARQSVLIHQKRLLREGCKSDEITEKIGAMYKEVSRCAAVFARRMAIADEVVIRRGEDSSEALKIIEEEHQIRANRRRGSMERRLSTCSMMSTHSFDSNRRIPQKRMSKKCPSSPASPTDEFYAAIA